MACALVAVTQGRFNSPLVVSLNEKVLKEEEHMTTVTLINGMLYAGVSIIVLVGVLAMSMGMVAGK